MKLNLNKDIFLENISLASRFTSSRLSSLPILQGVLLKGEKNIIHFYSTNLNSYYHTCIKAGLETPFEIIIEAKKIIEDARGEITSLMDAFYRRMDGEIADARKILSAQSRAISLEIVGKVLGRAVQ